MLYPARVSVCGTGARHVGCLADFLGSLITFAFAQPGLAYYRLSARTVDFPAILCTYGFNALFRQGAEVSLLRLRIAMPGSNGMLTVSAIGTRSYAYP